MLDNVIFLSQERLDQMVFQGPFQHELFSGTMINQVLQEYVVIKVIYTYIYTDDAKRHKKELM